MRIAIIGPGLMGKKHAGLIKSSKRLNLAGFVHPAGKKSIVAGFEELPVTSSIQELSRAVRLDGVIIATPNRRHIEDIEECSDLGLPMLIEKPITESLETALYAVELVERSHIPALVGFHRLYSPIVDGAQDILDSHRLGSIVCVSGSAKYAKPSSYFAEGVWRTQRGGGPLKINFVHDIATMIHLLGPVGSVQTMTSNCTRKLAVEDCAVINMSFFSGALGSFTVSDCVASCESWESTSGEDHNFPSYPDEACYEISGTLGSLKVPSLMITEPINGSPSWQEPYRRTTTRAQLIDPWSEQLDHFAEVIKGTARPKVTPRFALQVSAVMEAIDLAASAGKSIDVRVPTGAVS